MLQQNDLVSMVVIYLLKSFFASKCFGSISFCYLEFSRTWNAVKEDSGDVIKVMRSLVSVVKLQVNAAVDLGDKPFVVLVILGPPAEDSCPWD